MEPEEDIVQFFHQHPKLSKSSSRDSLPQELIIQILLRLPAKTLVKFRCVSKTWLALISSPEFIKNHLRISADDTHRRLVLTQHRYLSGDEYQYCFKKCSVSSLLGDNSAFEELYALDYPMNSTSENVVFVGSVNGLICLAVGSDDLFICNPSIRKFKKFTDPRAMFKCNPSNKKFKKFNNIPRAMFARIGLWHAYGFGYDEFHHDYKVVWVFDSGIADQVWVFLYSLNSDSWKRVDGFPSWDRLSVSAKFVNGKLYWTATAAGLSTYDGWYITSFDLASEKWRKVETPCYEKGGSIPTLGVLGSDLSVYTDYMHSHADIWVMKECGDKTSWTKMYTIEYPYCFPDHVSSPTLCKINEDEMLILSESTYTIYNPKEESIIFNEADKFLSSIESNIYIESLVCPPSTKPTTHTSRRKLRRRRMT